MVTPELAAALDRTKTSDRKATFVIAETARSLGHNIEDLAVNRDSIRRQRKKFRHQKAEELKTSFDSKVPLVVHWDGKLLTDLTGHEKVDRLPVIVSGKGISKLLTVAKLPSGTGEAQANAVYQTIEEWGITSSVQGMCFDTTSSNTGRLSGACVLLEQKMGRTLLSLACRHHIMELMIGAVSQACYGVKSSPEVPLFKRFQSRWQYIDHDKYETGVANDVVLQLIRDIKDDIIEFANLYLEQQQPREDYREFLELVMVFLGAVPSRCVRFMAPGPMHHARWMSIVIYSLKIWMFRSQFCLTAREERALMDICIFIVRIYVKAWFTAPLGISAAHNNL